VSSASEAGKDTAKIPSGGSPLPLDASGRGEPYKLLEDQVKLPEAASNSYSRENAYNKDYQNFEAEKAAAEVRQGTSAGGGAMPSSAPAPVEPTAQEVEDTRDWRARAKASAEAASGAEEVLKLDSTPAWCRDGGGPNVVKFDSESKKRVSFDRIGDEDPVVVQEVTTPSEPTRSANTKSSKDSGTAGGCCPFFRKGKRAKKQAALSATMTGKVQELFRKMDNDSSGSISRKEAKDFFKGGFVNLSVDAMFSEVDQDSDSNIELAEFVSFWSQVKGSGYSEDQILEELDQILEGNAWVDWKDNRSVGKGR